MIEQWNRSCVKSCMWKCSEQWQEHDFVCLISQWTNVEHFLCIICSSIHCKCRNITAPRNTSLWSVLSFQLLIDTIHSTLPTLYQHDHFDHKESQIDCIAKQHHNPFHHLHQVCVFLLVATISKHIQQDQIDSYFQHISTFPTVAHQILTCIQSQQSFARPTERPNCDCWNTHAIILTKHLYDLFFSKHQAPLEQIWCLVHFQPCEGLKCSLLQTLKHLLESVRENLQQQKVDMSQFSLLCVCCCQKKPSTFPICFSRS